MLIVNQKYLDNCIDSSFSGERTELFACYIAAFIRDIKGRDIISKERIKSYLEFIQEENTINLNDVFIARLVPDVIDRVDCGEFSDVRDIIYEIWFDISFEYFSISRSI